MPASTTPQPLVGVRLEHIYISPGHNFFGHHGKPPDDHPQISVPQVKCLAGRGLEGDRFLDYKKNYSGQITFFAMEVYDELCRATQVFDKAPGALRRNVFVRGVDLNALIGETFSLQDVVFSGSQECSPCYWMDQSFAPGSEAFLKNRGGLRARILSSGVLRVEAKA